MKSDNWQYAIGIIKFQSGVAGPDQAIEVMVSEPVVDFFTGALCQAARQLLGLSQEDLRLLAGVSRKTINDFENSLVSPSLPIVSDLIVALEKTGAEFTSRDNEFGVRVILDRKRFIERSRASRRIATKRAAADDGRPSTGAPSGSAGEARRGPGRPRKSD